MLSAALCDQISRSHLAKINKEIFIGYWYHTINVISFGLAQSDLHLEMNIKSQVKNTKLFFVVNAYFTGFSSLALVFHSRQKFYMICYKHSSLAAKIGKGKQKQRLYPVEIL